MVLQSIAESVDSELGTRVWSGMMVSDFNAGCSEGLGRTCGYKAFHYSAF